MIRTLVQSEFSKFFGEELAKELIEEYSKLKEAEIQRKHDYVCQIAGKYFETTAKILLKLKKGIDPSAKGINFEKACNELLQEQKITIEDEILTLLFPLVLKGGYVIRNKKRVSHARGINPDFMDSRYLCILADWIMAELLRLYHSKDDKSIQSIINKIIARKIPLLQEINGDKVLLDKKVSAALASLLLIYSNEGSMPHDQVKRILYSYYKEPNIVISIRNNINDRKIHEDNKNILHLTERGYQFLEKKLGDFI